MVGLFAGIAALSLCLILVTVRAYLLERRIGQLEDEVSESRAQAACLSAGVHELFQEVSAIKETVSDACGAMELQAKKEQQLFEGINSIMDYDVGVARKAVSGDAGE